MIELTSMEAISLDIFLAKHWAKFEAVAEDYLSPEEMDALIRKLELAAEAS